MYVVERERNLHFTVQVKLVTKNDLDNLTKQQFYFDWKKQFHHQMIKHVCREAIKEYGINGCVSLIPKTALKKHYSKKYGMKTAGKIVFLDGAELISMIQNYIL